MTGLCLQGSLKKLGASLIFIHSFRKCFRSPHFMLIYVLLQVHPGYRQRVLSTCSHFAAAFHQALCFQVAPALNMGITFFQQKKTASFGCKIVIIPNDFHKEPACLCRRHKRCRFDSWVGKILWRRDGNPLQYSCWRIPRMEKPGKLQSVGLHRARPD